MPSEQHATLTQTEMERREIEIAVSVAIAGFGTGVFASGFWVREEILGVVGALLMVVAIVVLFLMRVWNHG